MSKKNGSDNNIVPKMCIRDRHAEDGGLVLYIKRLEEGTFRLPSYDKESKSYPMQWRDLVLMVEGRRKVPSSRCV